VKKRLVILGSTGSIGTQTLDIVSAFPDRFEIVALSCGSNIELLKKQISEFSPKYVCVRHDADRLTLVDQYPDITFCSGAEGLIELAQVPNIDILVVAIFGTASLLPTITAIKNGTAIGLACKEILVTAGDLIMPMAKQYGAAILPMDSEHAALKQCLAGIDEDMKQVDRLILTASGGPFWERDGSTFSNIQVEDALKHPNWDMGAKITIDSATMMNKGLEVIEAHHLYQTPYDQIDVVIHPKSIVHSLVEFTDGTMLAQMGMPDMRFPIQYALTYPEKWTNPWPKADLTTLGALTFAKPDYEKFPLLRMAFDAGKQGGNAPAIMNAANEAAVHLFLTKQIGFTDIFRLVEEALSDFTHNSSPSLEELVAIDQSVKDKLGYTHA
jgi:1-deoxy-D-xylulose-5-phosphate reductoisomerase